MLWKRALWVISGLVVATVRLDAQAWDEPRVRDLVQRATDRRVRQLADSGLTGYQATAHGYVTFLAQLGVGFRELPRVVKADELALEVYWRAPNQSKQRIVGHRDTTLLPTDIQYHRDHLGIVQNNFPAIIRIGDGDEVRDVPHPLSPAGFEQYEFALSDSLRITTPGRVIDVYEIKVRPKDDQQPRFVGAVYMDRENAQVVRMAFGFTRPSYLDKQLEDVFVVLENGVVDGRFWLPRKQEIEIRRTATWLDYPVRGIIRGRWVIGDYTLTEAPAVQFVGPEIVMAPTAVLQRYAWPPGRITDSLPEESRLPTPEEIKRTLDEVRTLARSRQTQRGRASLLAHGASDFIRFDRNSGLSLGGGFGFQLGRLLSLETRASYGIGDKRVHGGVTLSARTGGARFSAFVSDGVRDVGDVAERSALMNSLAAQEFASDFTDRFGVRALGAEIGVGRGQTVWTVTGALESHRPLGLHAEPFRGTFQPAFDAEDWMNSAFVGLRVDRSAASGPLGFVWSGRGELRESFVHAPGDAAVCPVSPGPCYGGGRVHRGVMSVELERPMGDGAFASRLFAAATVGENFLRAQDLVLVGGPVSAPGFAYHELVGDRVVTQHTELRVPVPFLRFNLGRFGRMPGRAWLAPHWSVVGLHAVPSSTGILRGSGIGAGPDLLRLRPTGWYHSAGIGLVMLFDLLRLDAARELPNGHWIFSIDVVRSFWTIL